MKSNVEKINNYEVKLEIELPTEEFEKAIDREVKKLGEKVTIPGFRKGKVPRNILEMHIGKEYIAHVAFESVGGDLYEKALSENNLEPVTMPKFNPVTVETGKPLVFEAVFTVKPEVKLGEYKGVKVARKNVAISDEDIEKELLNIQKKHSKLVIVDDENAELKNGDMAIIDFTGYLDGVPFEGGEGKYYPLEIGSNTFIPGFEEKMLGMKLKETRDLELSFPEEYQKEELAGKDVVFKVTLQEMKNKEMPTIDDEFVKDISEYDTLAEYREYLSKRLLKNAEKQAQSEFETEVARLVVEGSEIDVPPAMIEERVDAIINDLKNRMSKKGLSFEQYLGMLNLSEEKLRQDYKQSAINEIKSELVLAEIVKVENLEATQEEIAEELKKIAESEKIAPKELHRLLYKQGRIAYVVEALQNRKAGRLILDTAIAE